MRRATNGGLVCAMQKMSITPNQGGNFNLDEAKFRLGFESALHPDCRGKSCEDVSATLKERHGDDSMAPAFRQGYDRGQQYLENREEVPARAGRSWSRDEGCLSQGRGSQRANQTGAFRNQRLGLCVSFWLNCGRWHSEDSDTGEFPLKDTVTNVGLVWRFLSAVM